MTRYVGIDLAKRDMKVCAVQEGNAVIERCEMKTDEKGRRMLCSFLRREDVVAMEVCGYANMLTRILMKQVGCEVRLFNPGGLVMVWKSRKKTGTAAEVRSTEGSTLRPKKTR